MKIRTFLCLTLAILAVTFSFLTIEELNVSAKTETVDNNAVYNVEKDGLQEVGYSSAVATGEGDTLPSHYCLRDEYIIYAQHQDKQGYCWNFASTMSASTAIMRHTNEYYDFSELWSGISCLYADTPYNKVGGGGDFNYYSKAIKLGGLMLETDLPYQYSYTVSNQNASDHYSFFNQYSNDNLVDCLVGKKYKVSQVDEIKQHIYNNGSAYMEFTFRTGYTPDENGVTALPPNQKNPNSAHAVSIVGWDDNYQREFITDGSTTPTLFKGAWIILNSYTETSGTDGLSFVFYNDLNVYGISAFAYERNLNKDLYFYDKIEVGYEYPTTVKGKYCGDFIAQNGVTKQKNIFVDDVNMEYSYVISSGASVKSVEIYLNNVNVTKDFSVVIDRVNKRFSIVKDGADYGQYKVLVTYGNDDETDVYLNNFFVTHGLIGEKLELNTENSDVYFNSGRDLEYYSIINSNKNYPIYTNQLSGDISFVPIGYTSIYSDKNLSIPTLSYEITDGKGQTLTHTVTANTGYQLKYNFNVEYYEDSTLQPVIVYYDLNGGVNHPKNYGRELANSTTDLVLYEPTREGYVFKGWYVGYGGGAEKAQSDGGLHYIDWSEIHHMGESPTLYASSYYKKYYKNSNVVFVCASWEEIATKEITVGATENGKITCDKSNIVTYFDERVYTITPDYGYKIKDVKVDGVSVGAVETYTFKNVTENCTITAEFEVITNEIAVGATENGKITCTGSTSPTYFDTITYIITPDEGYIIKDVKVDGVSVGAVENYTFKNVTENHVISAEFEIVNNKIVVTTEGKGRVNCNQTLDSVAYGDGRTLTITPEDGWKVLSVYVNGARVDFADGEIKVDEVKENTYIFVVFELLPEETGCTGAIGKTFDSNCFIIVLLAIAVSFVMIMKKSKYSK